MTYKELYDKVINLITNSAQNIDTYASSVPNSIRYGSGYSRSVTTGDFTYVNGPARAQNWYNPGTATGRVTVTWTKVDDAHHNIVSESVVVQQLQDFLSSLGIDYSNTETQVSTRGLINFYNNIASFLSVKLITVVSQETSNKFTFYNAIDSVTAKANYTSDMINNNMITASDVNVTLQRLKNTLPNVSRLSLVRYNIQYSSTSSCSSSSSSSSSSSCSSSSCSSSSCSTIFIAYFNPSSI